MFKAKKKVKENNKRFESLNLYRNLRELDGEYFLTSEDKMTTSTPEAISTFSISINDLLKDAQRIHEFKGDGSYALTSFLRDVDTILPLFDSCPQAKQYVFQRIIINKIQGPALDVIRTLGPDANWSDIKSALVQNFGVRESYHQLYHQAFSTRNNQVREYYNSLRKILSKLNEKYEYDIEKPIEFKPNVNEATILRTFLNNIDPNLASIILSRKIENLREAFNLLENLGMIRDKIKTNNFVNYNKPNNHSVNHNKNQFRLRDQNNHKQDFGQYRQNSNYKNKQNISQHFRQNYNNFRPNNNDFRQRNDQYSGQTRQTYHNRPFNNVPRHENGPEPMDIDHIQHEVNFQLMPRKFTYQ